MVSEGRLQPSGETLQFMQRIWQLAHALDVRSKRMLKLLGVTGPQRLVIRVIGQSPDIAPSEIAATLNIHPSTLTGILARLEERGLIEREIDADDRRRARVALTARGQQIDRERRGTVEAAIRRAIARTTPAQREAMKTMLALLVDELLREGAA